MTVPPADDPHAVLHWLYEHRERLPVWTVLDHPPEYPDAYIARCAFSLPTYELTDLMLASPELEPIRFRLASFGLTPMTRADSDPAPVMETWI